MQGGQGQHASPLLRWVFHPQEECPVLEEAWLCVSPTGPGQEAGLIVSRAVVHLTGAGQGRRIVKLVP